MFGLDTIALIATVKVMLVLLSLTYLAMAIITAGQLGFKKALIWPYTLGDSNEPRTLKVIELLMAIGIIVIATIAIYHMELMKAGALKEKATISALCTQAGGQVIGNACYNMELYDKSQALLKEATITLPKE